MPENLVRSIKPFNKVTFIKNKIAHLKELTSLKRTYVAKKTKLRRKKTG
jgi:hypothetical protein